MGNPPDWEEIEETLFAKAEAAILQFASEHPDEICSFFAFAWMPVEGDFSICFDTWGNAIRAAKEHEQFILASRNTTLGQDWSWESAHYFSTADQIVDYAPDVDIFAYSPYVDIWFAGWAEFSESDQYPQSQRGKGDYLDGNTRIVLWKVLQRLVENDAFARLRLSSPFRVGYQFHEEELVVIRILNWPD